MDKEIIRQAVEMLNESFLMQKDAMLLLVANGIDVTDASVLFDHVQIYSGIERLASVLGYELTGSGMRNDPSFFHEGIKYFQIKKEAINDLSVE